jgi:hypothetical protein
VLDPTQENLFQIFFERRADCDVRTFAGAYIKSLVLWIRTVSPVSSAFNRTTLRCFCLVIRFNFRPFSFLSACGRVAVMCDLCFDNF